MVISNREREKLR